MKKDDLIYVAGHRGLAGSSIVSELTKNGYNNLIYKTSKEVDLTDARQTSEFFIEYKPKYVFMCAGTVGGIMANNTYPVEFTQNNTLMAINVIKSAYENKVEKLLYLGSSCIYPKECPQPIKEDYLLTGTLEPTNEGYALAKILGIKLCSYYRREYGCDFISAMPSNLYGPNDNYDEQNSHVIAALIDRFHKAKLSNASEVVAWGSGAPLREFTYVDDFARGAIFAMNNYSDYEHINIGTTTEVTIKELTELVAKTVGFSGKIVFDTSKPDGTLRKVMDNSKLASLGFKPTVSLEEGLRLAYADYEQKFNSGSLNIRKPI